MGTGTRRTAVAVLVASLLVGSLLVGSAGTVGAGSPGATPVLVDPSQGRWYTHGPAGDLRAMFYGNPGDIPFVGDWDCDGVDSPGMYRAADGYVYLRNSNTEGVADIRFYFGNPGDTPLVGDFDGDGCDTVSVFRASEGRVYIIDRLGSGDVGLGVADMDYPFGRPGDHPVAGDWDGDGVDAVGAYRPSTGQFVLEKTLGGSTTTITFGNPGDRGLVADWDGDGVDGLGVYRPSTRQFHTRTDEGAEGTMPSFGEPGWLPVAGSIDVGGIPAGDPFWSLSDGFAGSDVEAVQHGLTEAKFYRGPVDGVWNRDLESAVVAFHKFHGVTRTAVWEPGDWERMDTPITGLGVPARPAEPKRLEADLTRQLLFFFDGGELKGIFPISSGGGYTYWSVRNQVHVRAGTPRGDFPLLWFASGWRVDSTTGWWLYNYWAFTPHYGLHGYLSVPAYPASHGCVRVTTWDADWLAPRLAVGVMIHIWD